MKCSDVEEMWAAPPVPDFTDFHRLHRSLPPPRQSNLFDFD